MRAIRERETVAASTTRKVVTVNSTAFYAAPILPGVALCGAVLILLIVPVFAVAAVGALVLVGLVLTAGLIGAALASPFLAVQGIRRLARSHGRIPQLAAPLRRRVARPQPERLVSQARRF